MDTERQPGVAHIARRLTWILAAAAVVALAIWLMSGEDAADGGGLTQPSAPPLVAPAPRPSPDDEAASSHARLAGSGSNSELAPQPLHSPAPDAARVRGRVVDPHGRPLPGVPVALIELDGISLHRMASISALFTVPRPDVRTDATGCFEIVAPGPAREFMVSLRRPDGADEWPSWVSVLPRRTIDIGELVLSARVHVIGRVQDSAGRPIEDAEVWVVDAAGVSRAMFSSAVGLFTHELMEHVYPEDELCEAMVARMPGAVRTRTDARGVYEADAILGQKADAFVAARAPGMTIERATWNPDAAGAVGVPTLVLRPAAARIAGSVALASGAVPPPGTVVTASARVSGNDGRFGRVVTVEQDGRFEVGGLLEGPHELRVRRPGWGLGTPVAANTGTSDVRLVLPEYSSLVVRPRGPDGQPLDHFDVLLGEPTSNLFGAYAWRRLHADPSAGGVLVVNDLRSQNFILQVLADGLAGIPNSVSVNSSGFPHDWNEQLRRTWTARGRVRDRASGAPVAGARLKAFVGVMEVPEGVAFADDEGVFEVRELPATKLTLRVESQGHATKSVELPARMTEPVVIELDAATLVHLRIGPRLADAIRAGVIDVHDEEADVSVTPFNAGRSRSYAMRPGGQALGDLEAGTWRVALLHDTGNMPPVEFTAVPGELVVVDF